MKNIRFILSDNVLLRRNCFLIICAILFGVAILKYPLPSVKGLPHNNAIRNEKGELIGYQPIAENNIPFIGADSIILKVAKYLIEREDPNVLYQRNLLKGDFRKNFYGVSLRFLKPGSKGGGSTFAQQILKNTSNNRIFLKRPERRSSFSKLAEMIGAIRLSFDYNPATIVKMYINSASFMTGEVGIVTAAESHFAVNFSQLNNAELYLLARSAKGIKDKDFNFKVIKTLPRDSLNKQIEKSYRVTLIANKLGTEEDLQNILKMPIRFKQKSMQFAVNDYLFSSVNVLPDSISKDGVQYISNLEPSLILAIDKGFKDYYKENNSIIKKAGCVLDASACIVDMNLGKIVGVNSYSLSSLIKDTTFSVRNRINEPIIPGSTIKGLLVAKGINDRLINPRYLVLDAPVGRVHNHNNHYRGWITLREAMKYSSNTFLDNHPNRNQIVGNTEMILQRALGSKLKSLPADKNPSQYILGQSREISLLQLAQLYRAFLTNGIVYPANIFQRVLDTRTYPFTTIYAERTEPLQLFSPAVAPIMRDILTGPLESGGTLNSSGKLIKKFPNQEFYGKTGTSDSYQQGTTVIVDNRYLVAVNVQYIPLKKSKRVLPIPGHSGGASAGRIAAYIFNHLN